MICKITNFCDFFFNRKKIRKIRILDLCTQNITRCFRCDCSLCRNKFDVFASLSRWLQRLCWYRQNLISTLTLTASRLNC